MTPIIPLNTIDFYKSISPDFKNVKIYSSPPDINGLQVSIRYNDGKVDNLIIDQENRSLDEAVHIIKEAIIKQLKYHEEQKRLSILEVSDGRSQSQET